MGLVRVGQGEAGVQVRLEELRLLDRGQQLAVHRLLVRLARVAQRLLFVLGREEACRGAEGGGGRREASISVEDCDDEKAHFRGAVLR